MNRVIVASADPVLDDVTVHDSRFSAASLGNKNPRTKIRGKAAGSLREEAKKLGPQSQSSKQGGTIIDANEGAGTISAVKGFYRHPYARWSALLLLVIGGSIWLCPPRYDPLCHGKRTSEWVKLALQEEEPGLAFDIVVKIGKPAAPFIAEQGLHDACHRFHFLAYDEVDYFKRRHPRLGRWISDRDNCVIRHNRAQRLLSQMTTNGFAALPDLIACVDRCPNLHYVNTLDLVDAIGDVSGTNSTAIPALKRWAKSDWSINLRAATTAYYINNDTNLMVETLTRLARKHPAEFAFERELFWFRDDDGLNRHVIPLLVNCYTTPGLQTNEQAAILDALAERGAAGASARAQLLSHHH